MLVEIVIGSIGDSLQLLDAEWELKFDIVRSFRIVGALLRWDFMDMKRLGGYPDVPIETESFLEPILQQLQAVFRPAEIFEFHLLELAGSKGEIARIDFVAECFADLSDSEWELFPGDL